MRRTIGDWLKILVLLLDEAAAVALVFFILWALGIEIPITIIIAIGLLVGIIIIITYKAVIPSFHKKQVAGAEGLIGLEGEVVEPLVPIGAIKVGGEYWKAKSAGENIGASEEVEILGVEGLTLMVRLKDR